MLTLLCVANYSGYCAPNFIRIVQSFVVYVKKTFWIFLMDTVHVNSVMY